MKNIIIVLIFLLVDLSFIYGNGGPPPPLPFLNSEVSGLPYRAPLFFADTNSVTIISQFSFFTPSSIDGNINVEGTSEASLGIKPDHDLVWKIPGSSFNGGLSFNTGKNWAFFIVIKIDNTENGIIANADVGGSLLLSSVSNVRARLDFGFSSLSMNTKTTFISVGYNNDTSYTVKTENDKSWDPFISLTLNTAFDDWIINPYLQLSYCYQTLFNIDWSQNEEVYSNIHVYTLTPGIIFRINNNILLIAGGSYFIPQIEEKSSGIFSGFVQANFMF